MHHARTHLAIARHRPRNIILDTLLHMRDTMYAACDAMRALDVINMHMHTHTRTDIQYLY